MSEVSQVGIPKPIADDVRKIIRTLGYRSLSEFVVEATRLHLQKKVWDYEKKVAEQEEAIVKKHEQGPESIEHEFDSDEDEKAKP